MSETPSVKKKGLQPKDLINIGIFTALYFIIIMAVAMLGYVPIFIPLLSVICPLIGGIPYMLYITKVRHFGMVFIMGTILGLLMGLGGMGVYAFITGQYVVFSPTLSSEAVTITARGAPYFHTES